MATTRDPEYLGGMQEIIVYTGIPRTTFYRKYMHRLKKSRYVYCRRGRYGRRLWWSYKRLILAWQAEQFPPPDLED